MQVKSVREWTVRKQSFLGNHFLNEMCTKTYIIYTCTSIYFNLIPQKSAQESIKELHFKVESPITLFQASNSLYFKPSQLLRVSYTETSVVIHFDFLLFRKYHWKVALNNNYLLVFDILLLFLSMCVFLKHHRHYHLHCMTEKLWYKHTKETTMGQAANHWGSQQ